MPTLAHDPLFHGLEPLLFQVAGGAEVRAGWATGVCGRSGTARAGWLRGVVGTAVRAEPDGSLRTVEVGGAHGVFLGAALSLSLARPSIP